MNIGIITYTAGHLQAFLVAQYALRLGSNVHFFAFPFKSTPRKFTPRFQDRPYPILSQSTQDFSSAYTCKYTEIGGWSATNAHLFHTASASCDVVATCISKIIPSFFLNKTPIVNAHPGYLPFNRGVDAFKRSVINTWPIGVSLHQIDAEIDAGRLIQSFPVPILPEDDLSDICQRSFLLEIELLARSPFLISRAPLSSISSSDIEYPLSHNLISLSHDHQLASHFSTNRDLFMFHNSQYFLHGLSYLEDFSWACT